MKNLKLIYNILLALSFVGLAIYVFSDKENYPVSKSNVLNTVLNSEINNDKPQKNKNIIIKNPDFTVAAEKTINSVVHVKNTTSAKNSNSLWDLFYGNSDDRTTVGTGSGVIVSSDGYIITNNHVIENATQIEITTNDNKSYDAELIGSDKILT